MDIFSEVSRFFSHAFDVQHTTTAHSRTQQGAPAANERANNPNHTANHHATSSVECCRRQSLKSQIEDLSESLNQFETAILQDILATGNDDQVALADERLADIASQQEQQVPSTTTTFATSDNDKKKLFGSKRRRSTLDSRRQNNQTHVAMLRAFARQRWKRVGKKILHLNKRFGSTRVRDSLERFKMTKKTTTKNHDDNDDVRLEVEKMQAVDEPLKLSFYEIVKVASEEHVARQQRQLVEKKDEEEKKEGHPWVRLLLTLRL